MSQVCLAEHVLRDYFHLDRDQHDWCGKSRNFNGVGAWRLPSAKSVDWYPSFEEDPAEQIVGLPNFQKDEVILQEPLENLGRCHSAEKHVRILFAMVFLRPVGLPTTLEETKSGTSPPVSLGVLLISFMTIHLFQFRFADVVDAKTSGGNCPCHDCSRNRC